MDIVEPPKNSGEIGVKHTITIKRLNNGEVQIEALHLTGHELRDVLQDLLNNLNEELAVNAALGMLATYLENKEKQAQILQHIRGGGGKPH
jgi:hypothetical protein